MRKQTLLGPAQQERRSSLLIDAEDPGEHSCNVRAHKLFFDGDDRGALTQIKLWDRETGTTHIVFDRDHDVVVVAGPFDHERETWKRTREILKRKGLRRLTTQEQADTRTLPERQVQTPVSRMFRALGKRRGKMVSLLDVVGSGRLVRVGDVPATDEQKSPPSACRTAQVSK